MIKQFRIDNYRLYNSSLRQNQGNKNLTTFGHSNKNKEDSFL